MRTPAKREAHVSRDDRDTRGASLSLLVSCVLVALFLVTGLVVDGGARVRAQREAEVVAAQAARAGSDATAAHRLVGADGTGEGLAAARTVLAGHPEVTGTVAVQGGALVVHTRTSSQTTFLSLLGITSFEVTGSAAAELRAR